MESFVGWLGLVLVVLGAVVSIAAVVAGWLGWSEIKKIKDIREKAEKDRQGAEAAHSEARAKSQDAHEAAAMAGTLVDGLKREMRAAGAAAAAIRVAVDQARSSAEDAASRAEQAAHELERIRSVAVEAQNEIDGVFQQLPQLETGRRAGAAPPPVAPTLSLVFEEADMVLVVCDRMNWLPKGSDLAPYFIRLGKYWRAIGNFPRSLARMERAVKLAPSLSDAHWQLGRTLAYQATELLADAPERRELLQRADEEIQEAGRLAGGHDSNTLEDLGWIRHGRGEYQGAAEAFREARRVMRQRQPDDETEWFTTFNLACSLSLAGDYEGALGELEGIMDPPARREQAREHPDLKPLLSASPWRERFLALTRDDERPTPTSA